MQNSVHVRLGNLELNHTAKAVISGADDYSVFCTLIEEVGGVVGGIYVAATLATQEHEDFSDKFIEFCMARE